MNKLIFRVTSILCMLTILCGVVLGLASCTDHGGEQESETPPEYTLPSDSIF